MTLEQLNNLVRIGELREEPFDAKEFNGLVTSARERLQDISQNTLSAAGQFDLLYNASHALALAALRHKGYRSHNRYQVFQCLVHTLVLSVVKTQVFTQCHQRRNVAEYQGHLEIEEVLLKEFHQLANELLTLVEALEPIE